ncbi:hypothetical protein GWI33_006596 [Rhynchophorus ferrugineus]|uniref:DUF4781 domain-containing protein n=1 Tax=Rhynchophorus ferrugineus TaxID=354439 RepID=A0A834ILJ8_RHYFE|nr:hypothetical protein GWI33_006596 [Rhynchophorus ferrugineus]
MGESQIEFFITCGDLAINIVLGEYDTVGDLRRQIENRLNMPVEEQNILGWYEPPTSHQTILQCCTSPDRFQCLTVKSGDAITIFKYKFPNININIHTLGFEDALSCLKNNNLIGKKAFLFYLHKHDDPFNKICIDAITKNDITDFINEYFIFIGWNIENNSYQKPLLSALHKYTNLSIIGQYINEQRAGLVCIFHDRQDFRVFFCLSGNISSPNVLTHLRAAQESVCKERDFSDMELEAINSFKNKIPLKSTIVIHNIKLQNAINLICTAPLKERKAILLYLHNSDQSFSHMFSEHIYNDDLIELLNRSFILIGWDVEEEKYHDTLKSTLNEYVNLSIISESVSHKNSLAVCIIPVANNIRVFMCFKGNISYKEISESLNTVEKTLKEEIKEEEDLQLLTNQANQADNINAEKLQEIFAQMLCDRDYDRFEYNEHNYLKDKIGYALKGPPTDARGYDDKTKKNIESLYDAILSTSNKIAEFKDLIDISFIYNCTEPLPSEKIKRSEKYTHYNPNTDITTVPVFVLRKCRGSDNPCRLFVDDCGRVYKTWQDYLIHNKLPECHMTVPCNGRYQMENDQVLLEKHLSPACHLDTKILNVGDVASMTVGLLSGAVFVAAAIPAVTVAPVIVVSAAIGGIAAGVWSIGRSIHSLIDRGTHEETLSFLNSEARGAYLNIVAGSLGFVGAGANVAMTQLVSRGFNISQGAAYAFNTVGVLNITASGVSIVNSGYDVLDQWLNERQRPSALAILQLTSSVLFFGHAVYNFKGATQIIQETQAQVLQDYQESLRSNRHRKTFNKLMKETIRSQGDSSRGKAEVISAIRKIQNKDDVFAALTRNNREMNRKGIKYSIDAGEIKFNGISVDMNEFVALNKKEAQIFLGKISEQSPNPLPTVQADSISANFSNNVRNTLSAMNIDVSSLNYSTVILEAFNLLAVFTEDIREKLLNIVQKTIDYILEKCVGGLLTEFNEIIPKKSQFSECLQWIISYFTTRANELESKYQLYKQTGNSIYYDPLFDHVNPEWAKRGVYFFEYAVKLCYHWDTLLPEALRKISEYVAGWIVKYIYDDNVNKQKEKNRVMHSAGFRNVKVKCAICGGYYFQEKS